MKKISIIVLLLLTAITSNAQRKVIDSLRIALKKATVDTVRLNILTALGYNYFISHPDSCIIYTLKAYELSEKYHLPQKQARALNILGNAYGTMGDYAKGIQFYYKALRIFESSNNVSGIVMENNNIGATYVQDADYKNAVRYLQIAKKQWMDYMASHKLTRHSDREQKPILYVNIGEAYLYTNKIDSADYYLEFAYQDAKKNNFTELINNIERDLGEVEIARSNKPGALKYLREAARVSIINEDMQMLSMTYLSTAKLYHNYKQQDSANFYAKKALETAQAGKYQQDVLNAGKVLYNYYDADNNLPEAYKYYKLTTAAKDSLYSQDKLKQLLSLDFEEKQRKQEIEAAQNEYGQQVRTYTLIGSLLILLLLVFVFWRNARQRQVANTLLQAQKEEIEATLEKLQLTQSQLVQSEKMASLGELTAGIAHEIQNPLNFINNFSEVNKEMIEEMEEELKLGNLEEALSIAADIKQNEEKIAHHGKRADGIVKGMLQHSRNGSGQKELTDINKLADEYLRLSYHGLRAKDKSFNATMEADFDEHVPQVSVNQQDIGRVILNLLTNAFYAVNEKSKSGLPGYAPTVKIRTKKSKSIDGTPMVEITIADNGVGIPQKIRDKIYQPFFTTKPTGQGTGLGLSMSYDIIKAHNGDITITSTEGEGTEFLISLPIA